MRFKYGVHYTSVEVPIGQKFICTVTLPHRNSKSHLHIIQLNKTAYWLGDNGRPLSSTNLEPLGCIPNQRFDLVNIAAAIFFLFRKFTTKHMQIYRPSPPVVAV